MSIPSRVRATMAPPLTPLMERAARLRHAGRELFVLAQAMVDYPPPPAFTRTLEASLRAGDRALHQYAPDPGTPAARRALAGYLARSFGLACDHERELLVTPGANQAAYQLMSALLDPGDEVLLVSPWYFNHEMTARLLGARVRTVAAEASRGFVPQIEAIRAAWSPRLRLLVLVSPNNPTGARYPDSWMRALAASLAADERWAGVAILSDQTYQELAFEGSMPLSPAALPEWSGRVFTVGSFSKSFALAGWRLGFLAGPAETLEEVLKIQDSSVICAPHAAQIALAAALEAREEAERYLEEKRLLLRRRRDALLSPLRADGRCLLSEPGGACFVFLGLPAGAGAASAFAEGLLEAEGVVIVPGEAFGPGWERFARASFGTESEQRLAEAARRIVRHLDAILGPLDGRGR